MDRLQRPTKKMAKISDITEAKIKAAMKIEDVLADQGVVLHRRGAQLVGLCPFHDDRSEGSFQVSTAKNICSCYACGAVGLNPIDTLLRLKYSNLSEKEAYPAALRYLAAMYNIYVDEEEAPKVEKKLPKLPSEVRPKTQLMLWHADIVKPFKPYNEWNPLLKYLQKLPLSENDNARMERAINNYAVGTYPQGKYEGWTIWWYIDMQGYVHTGKMMAYKQNGHRDKEIKPNFTWAHSLMQRWKTDKDGNEYENPNWKWDNKTHHIDICFFGEHLINFYPDAVIYLVESEKTAVFCSAFTDPKQAIWIASGGLQMMSDDKLINILRFGRTIELMPDIDGYDKWEQKIMVSQKLRPYIDSGHLRIGNKVKKLWKPEDGEKADIADIMIRIVTTPQVTLGMKVAAQLGSPEKAEVMDQFIEALNLKEI